MTIKEAKNFMRKALRFKGIKAKEVFLDEMITSVFLEGQLDGLTQAKEMHRDVYKVHEN